MDVSPKAPVLQKLKVSCRDCSLHQLCLPGGINRDAVDQIDAAVERQPPITSKKELFRQGDAHTRIFVVRSGSLRSSRISEDGREQIMGFHFPGDLVGLDALESGTHQVTATTLERTHVCALPTGQLDAVLEQVPALGHQLMRIMSRNHTEDLQHLDLISRKSAPSRVAGWLLALDKRLEKRGYSTEVLHLHMARKDLGNYLGLAIETISRAFATLRKQGLITVDGRQVRILDRDALIAMAGSSC